MPKLVGDIRGLLAGDTVEIEGATTRMLHWPGPAPDRPIEVPFVLGVNGPKGLETAAAMRCGVITSRPRPDAAYDRSFDVILLGFGTIMDEGEILTSPRVINTAGPGAMVSYHAFLERHDARLDRFPNAMRFVELASAVDPGQRHFGSPLWSSDRAQRHRPPGDHRRGPEHRAVGVQASRATGAPCRAREAGHHRGRLPAYG